MVIQRIRRVLGVRGGPGVHGPRAQRVARRYHAHLRNRVRSTRFFRRVDQRARYMYMRGDRYT